MTARHASIVVARLAGRCSTGAELGAGTLWHAVDGHDGTENYDGHSMALCGARPGRLSAGWIASADAPELPTCRRCAVTLARLEGMEPECSTCGRDRTLWDDARGGLVPCPECRGR